MADINLKSTILVSCPKGLPPFLAAELRDLCFPVLAEKEAGVETEGTLADAMKLNLHIRTGHRVLWVLRVFKAATAEELYTGIRRINWEKIIPADGYVSVDSFVQNDSITDTRFANLKCKDAIVDRVKDKCGKRPDSGSEGTRAAVFLYWREDTVVVYLNTTGIPLAKRGYRKIPMQAPMQETLAAGVVLATGWKGAGAFVNPMCGSGTLCIEAALIALKKAPGLLRGNYAFMHFVNYNAAEWLDLRNKAKQLMSRSLKGAKIIASDINPQAVDAARKNATTAGVDHLIEFHVCDFAETPVPEGGGVVVFNPEYGERMGEETALAETYGRMGDFLKNKCAGYKGYIFTGNSELAKKIGLRTKRRIPFFNSKIECRLLEYELYPGSRHNPLPAPG